jgi:polysaccharide export outer membrane protein
MKLASWMLLGLVGGGMTMAAEPPADAATAAPAVAVASARATPLAAATAAPGQVIPEGYELRPGDMLTVSVWNEKDLQGDVLIRPDGGISFALAGEVQAAGHTVAELTRVLEARIRKFIPDAVVTVSVKAAIGNRIYVVGKVNKPGDFALTGPIDVMQALSLAGGATPFANTNAIRILRRDGNREVSIKFRYGDIERGRKLDQNIVLQNGDTVVVP